MNGKTHKAIGVTVGISMAVYGMLSDQPDLFMGLVTAPIGAMLPDIDHNASRMGRVRKKAFDAAQFVAIGAGIVFLGVFVRGLLGSYQYMKAVSVILLIGGAIVALSNIAKIPFIRKAVKFLTKHRGLMHTSFIVALCVYGALNLQVSYLKMLVVGLGLGYASHLLADCMTSEGCPLLWPLTSKCFSVLRVKCGSKGEYVTGAILCGGILCLALMLPR